VRNSLQWGSWVCVWAACGCGAGAHRSGESDSVGVRSSALVPTVGPEIGTDTPVLKQADVGHNPVVASGGAGFLAVQEVDSHIRAVRVDANGKVLDATWLDFGEGTEAQYYPSVAFGGGHFLVTWTAFGADSTVRGRFVRPDGTLEGTSAFTLTSGQAMYPSVGWTGSQFLVSWLELGGGDGTATVAAFDSSGNKIANSEYAVSNPASVGNPRIAVGSRRALVVWDKYVHDDITGDVGRIYGALVDLNGAPVGSGEFPLSNSPSSETTASVAATDSHFLVVWNTQDYPTSIFGSSIDDNGVFDNEDVTLSHSTETTGLASVVSDGSNYLVAWADGRDQQSIYGARVSASGVPLATDDVKLATGSPRYVSFGDRTALAFSGGHPPAGFRYLLSFLGNGIEGSLLDFNLQIQNGSIPLTGVAASQGYPNLVFDGTDYVVQWTDERESNTDMSVRAVRIDASGHVRDPDSVVLSTAEAPAFSASLGSTGNNSSLSLWSGISSGSYRRTLAADGTLGALAPFATELSSSPTVASDGTGYLAVFMTGDSSDGAIFGQLLDAAGNGDAAFQIDSSSVNTGPNVFKAADGGYLLSYAKAGTRLIPVSATGQVGTSVELSPNISFASAATGAGKTLVAWTDTNDTQVRARFFEAGALSADTLVLAESTAGYLAALSWDGASFFAIWETPEHHLDGRNIAADGTLGPVTTLVSEESYGPVSASNAQGQVLVSYIKYGEGFRSRRIASRLIGAVVDGGGGSAGSGGTAGASSGNPGDTGGAGSAGASSGDPGSAGASSATAGGAASSTAGSGGAIGTAGSGTAGSGTAGRGTAGTTGSAGSSHGSSGGNQPPIIIKCSVTQVGNRGASSSATLALGSLLLAVAGAFARRRRARNQC